MTNQGTKAVSPADNEKDIENHKKAAKHSEEAAKHHEAGEHEKAAQSTVKAHGHHALAAESQKEDVKNHASKS